jgi:AraC family transcriptional regulator, regulatory protein of adaptative response / methylated-DNA-[protein]-cysteine methyltransferase
LLTADAERRLLDSDLKARIGLSYRPPVSIKAKKRNDWSGKMHDVIRFAWGTSSLGDFVAARSDKGLVTFEFADQRAAMEDALRARFPDAEVLADQDGLADIVDKLNQAIEHPGFDPEILLDLRGTAYEVSVWRMLGDTPIGETTNYGALAAKLGTRDAREVTEAISANSIAILVPCHRIIKKDGSISGYRWGVRRKRALLERERTAARLRT